MARESTSTLAYVATTTDEDGVVVILPWSTESLAKDVRRNIAEMFDDDLVAGWGAAKKAGYRVRRCTITLD
ncbi:hypothetical protein [Rhodoplanes elegans]|nr:hypothetical protein [Rhodoplanes elegans]